MRRLVRVPAGSLPLLAAALVSSCAAANRPATRITDAEAIRATLDSATAVAVVPVPEVRLRAEQEFGRPNEISTVMRLDDDAYVMVVNVGPDGYARVVFPERPDDDGFLRGGRSYRLPGFFPGFATSIPTTAGAEYLAFVPYRRSEFASAGARGPGYLFALASSRPMDLQAVEEFGLWDEFRLPLDGMLLDPRYLIRYYQDAIFGERQVSGVSASIARYAGWVSGGMRHASASCAMGNSGRLFAPVGWRSGYGYDPTPIWATSAYSYGIGGPSSCDVERYFPYRRRPTVPRWAPSPPPVVPPRDSTNPAPPPSDSGAAPGEPAAPVGQPFEPGKPGVAPPPAVITDGETIDLTPAARRLMRREGWLARERNALERAGGPVWTRRARGAEGRPMPRGVEMPDSGSDSRGRATRPPRAVGRAVERAPGSGGRGAPSSGPAPAPAAAPASTPATERPSIPSSDRSSKPPRPPTR